jgi:hypothetical protein
MRTDSSSGEQVADGGLETAAPCFTRDVVAYASSNKNAARTDGCAVG